MLDTLMETRVLVIDDNQAIHADFQKILCDDRVDNSPLETLERSLFGRALNSKGQVRFKVDSAHQAHEGLARVHHALQEGFPYALAFVDVRMPPGQDGIELVPQLCIADPNLSIVICTAYSDYSWENIFERLGNSERIFILKKPFDRMEILQLAHTLTARQRSRSLHPC